MSRQILTAEEARVLITSIGPSLGCGDYTGEPVFPEARKDICAVRRMAENGYSYGFDTVYLVWKDEVGKIYYLELINSRSTKDYIQIESVEADGNQVTVKFTSGGSYSGSPWKNYKRIAV